MHFSSLSISLFFGHALMLGSSTLGFNIMELYPRDIWRFVEIVLLFSFMQVVFLTPSLDAQLSNLTPKSPISNMQDNASNTKISIRQVVEDNKYKKATEIIVTYIDSTGILRSFIVKTKDLSSSWIQGSHIEDVEHPDDAKEISEQEGNNMKSTDENILGDIDSISGLVLPISPAKQLRQQNRLKRRRNRIETLLMKCDEQTRQEILAAAIAQSKQLNTKYRGKYSIWKREASSAHSVSTSGIMMDQIIMARLYASIAWSNQQCDLYNSLLEHIKGNRNAIGERENDAGLHKSVFVQAKTMGHMLSLAKCKLYDCALISRRLRVMVQSSEENIRALKKKGAFLMHLVSKSIPSALSCLPLQLTTDYFLLSGGTKCVESVEKFEDTTLYHYAIFSDNVLATSVVINSTLSHAKDPGKHVFHIVTNKWNFAAMKMWFLVNSPEGAAIEVKNVDDFKWLNSSYCPVLQQLESARIKEYYFKENRLSSLLYWNENLKYKNPKYLSILNHLRFYIPEIYPKLKKILFLDDDIVVQRDLTPLWSIDLKGMVNGAVETCKASFHRLNTYVNFSNPAISQNFDPNSCGWAFGMNIFDLKEWKRHDITKIYHHWQSMNANRTLWQLGSLPPGLITFYNLTFPLDRSWHILGLGYDPTISQSQIESAAVIHYNGNYKPWMDLAISRYRHYWLNHIKFGNPYLQVCNINK